MLDSADGQDWSVKSGQETQSMPGCIREQDNPLPSEEKQLQRLYGVSTAGQGQTVLYVPNLQDSGEGQDWYVKLVCSQSNCVRGWGMTGK